jgi:membrane-associated phospholipid phosphatase
VVKILETWFIVLGLINLGLLLFGLYVFFPRKNFKTIMTEYYKNFRKQLPYLLIIIGVVTFHLIQVNLLDPLVTDWVGIDFANNIQSYEGEIVYSFYRYWNPILIYFFVIMYIVVYPFTLWFAPLYFLFNDEKKSMKNLSYGLLIIYIVALPFYMFLPVTNVYNYYGLESSLEAVIPSVENFFYTTTTLNNCIPSLHTAMTILIAWSVYLTGNKKLLYFSIFTMICVFIAVVFLIIHWITDVIFGALLALIVIFLLNHFINKEKKNDNKN